MSCGSVRRGSSVGARAGAQHFPDISAIHRLVTCLSRITPPLVGRSSEATLKIMVNVADRVSWMISQVRTRGEIEERRTTDFQFDGQTFTASENEPAFIVKSEKSGKRAG